MAASRNDIQMRITADSRGVVTGIAPMLGALEQAQVAAQETEKSLDGIGSSPINLTVHDEAIQNTRAEIARLSEEMATRLRLDPQADTSDIDRQLSQLQRKLRTLDKTKPVVDVEVDTTRVDRLVTSFTTLEGVVSGARGIGGQGLGGGLLAASRGLGAVGGEAAAAAAPIAAVGGAMILTGGAAYKLGLQAADAETSIAQLDALTQGMGEETFGQLQQFAAETPFAMDEVTAATKRLVAAGVPLQDLPDNIHDMGEVAAATGVPIEQVATIFSQMVSKGKASYEELQQLAEAGIPVWQVLADKLGMSVAQVQQLATEGKLGADAITLLRESLADTYSGAMQRQAETFNGRLSTLRDTFTQIGQNVGTTFLPAMKDLLFLVQEMINPVLEAAQAWSKFNDQMEQKTGFTFLDISPLFLGLDLLNGGLKDTEEQVDETGSAFTDFGSLVTNILSGVEAASADAEKQAQQLKDAFQAAVDEFEGIGGTIRTRVDFIISRDDLKDAIRQATEGTKDEKAIQLPADLKIGQITGLTDKQQDLVSNLSDFAQMGLEEGARQAQIDPQFDAQSFYRDLRSQLKPLVLEAGIDPKNVNQFLQNVLGVPAPWKVQPELTGLAVAQSDMALAFPPVEVPIEPNVPPQARGALESSLGIDLGDATTDGLTAEIAPEINQPSLTTATGKLDTLTEDRTVDIHINPVLPPGGTDVFGFRWPGPAPTAPAPSTSSGDDRRPTVAAPQRNKVDVSVYLDGRMIGRVPGKVGTRSARRVA